MIQFFATLQQPITEQMVKSEFRRLAKKFHSDTGGSDQQFIELKKQYDQFLKTGQIVLDLPTVLATNDGTPLSELGLGLKTNGQTCESCQGRGYHQHTVIEFCKRCNGTWIVSYCSTCQRVLSNNWPWPIPCCPHSYVKKTTCDCDRGYVRVPKKQYWKCGLCDGTGEVPIFNPVIIKGTIGGGFR